MTTQASRAAAERPALSQAAVNKANAQHSTGPKTEHGKTVASQNSFKHGLYSNRLVIKGEDPAQLNALRADLFAEHQPQSETEALLVNEMAEQYWRLRRARRLEVQFLENGAIIAHIAAAQRMVTSAERGFHKALKTLQDVQKQRGFVPQKRVLEQPAPLPPANPTHAAPSAKPQEDGGFVSQSAHSREITVQNPPKTRSERN